jgi:hypothetical protein
MLPESRVAVCESSQNTLRLYDIYGDIESGKRFVRTTEGMLPLSELKHFVREEPVPPRPIHEKTR